MYTLTINNGYEYICDSIDAVKALVHDLIDATTEMTESPVTYYIDTEIGLVTLAYKDNGKWNKEEWYIKHKKIATIITTK